MTPSTQGAQGREAQEAAEKYAKEYCMDFPTETYHPNDLRMFSEHGFLAGHSVGSQSAKALEIDEESIVKVIEEWKHGWMNVAGTDEADRKNYFNRAFGIDANMKYGLARLLINHFKARQTLAALTPQNGETP